jgi:hypothetical protein
MMQRKGSRIPNACYNRVKGFMFLGSEFKPDSHKTHINPTNELWQDLCAGRKDKLAEQFAGTNQDTALNLKFQEWLKACHAFDQDVKFTDLWLKAHTQLCEVYDDDDHVSHFMWRSLKLAGKEPEKKKKKVQKEGKGGKKGGVEGEEAASLELKPGDRVQLLNKRNGQREYGTVYCFATIQQQNPLKGRVLVLPIAESLADGADDALTATRGADSTAGFSRETAEKCEWYDVFTELQSKLDAGEWAKQKESTRKKLPHHVVWADSFESKPLDSLAGGGLRIRIEVRMHTR